MKQYGITTAILLLILGVAISAAFASGSSEASSGATGASSGKTGASGTSGSVSADFWAAPNPAQEAFWKQMADAYMKNHANVKINVTSMPESPSSEAGIQTALAGGTAPAASENIFIGFGAQLYSSDAIVPLDTLQDWSKVLHDRRMENTVSGWKFPDGHYYILPMYVNAMLMGWRTDIMRSVGVDKVPRTYSEVLDLAGKVKARYGSEKFLWARQALTRDTWWQRWFDFFMFYYAAANGTPVLTGGNFTANSNAAENVLQLFQNLYSSGYLLTKETKNPFETGLEVMDSIGPWTFPNWAQQYPELQYGKNYDLSPPPVPDGYPAGKPIKTFADAKGVVVYKQAPEAQRRAVWSFISWVLSDPRHDLTWLEKTNLPPARDDLATNSAFKTFFDSHPELVPYANEIPYAVPPIASSQVTELQKRLGDLAVVPAVTGKKSPREAWNDWTSGIQDLLK